MTLILYISYVMVKKLSNNFALGLFNFQWISQTVLCKLVKEIDEINAIFKKMGSSELQIGCKFIFLKSSIL